MEKTKKHRAVKSSRMVKYTITMLCEVEVLKPKPMPFGCFSFCFNPRSNTNPDPPPRFV